MLAQATPLPFGGADPLGWRPDLLGAVDREWDRILSADLRDEAGQGVIAGRYWIEARLRRGARASWYRVRHLRLGEQAVLCLLRRSESDNRFLRDGLWREAERARRIDSLHVLPLSDIGTAADGRVFFAHPLPEAPSLARCMRSPLPLRYAAALLGQLADAVAAIHAAGIVAYALDPEHVFVADRPRGPFVWLQLLGPASQLERVGGATSRYRAPEQRRGQVLHRAANIYSFAAIARDVLAGPRGGPRGDDPSARAIALRAGGLRSALDPVPAQRPSSVRVIAAELLARVHEHRLARR